MASNLIMDTRDNLAEVGSAGPSRDSAEAWTDERRCRARTRLDDLALDEREVIAEFKRHRRDAALGPDRPRIGEILVATGEISPSQLSEALERARKTGRRIGEELVAAGLVSGGHLRRALGMQRRLMIAALLAGLMGQAEAAEVRAFMTVSATVVDTVGIRAVYQAQSLVISSQDVERGYVDVPAASRFEIRNKGATLLELRATGNFFRSIRITGPEGSAEFGPAGGTMLQKSVGTGAPTSVALGYRFELAAGVTPGAYKWPLSLTVLPM